MSVYIVCVYGLCVCECVYVRVSVCIPAEK